MDVSKTNNKFTRMIASIKSILNRIINKLKNLSSKHKAIAFLFVLFFVLLVLIIVKVSIVPTYTFIGSIASSDKVVVSKANATLINLTNSTEDIVISKGGEYYIVGYTNNQIIINCKQENVYLLLGNANINVSDKPAILCKKAKKLVISLEQDSTNTITSSYVSIPSEYNGVLYSKSKLVINGNGELNITGNNTTGIHSSDELVLTNSTINITTTSNETGDARGIKVNDHVLISDVNLNITSNGDGIKCEDISSKNSIVSIISGNITINSKGDGIQAKTRVEISGGNIDINAGYNSLSSKAIKAEDLVYITGGIFKLTAIIDKAINSSIVYIKGGEMSVNSTTCINGENKIYVLGGSFNLTATKNGLYAPKCYIDGGDFIIDSDNKGIKTIDKLVIKSGNIKVASSYEGFESAIIKINGGNIQINSSDDGMNINCEPHDGMGGFGESSNKVQKESGKLVINGGNIYVKAGGDGLDSNDKIIVRGGIILVDGPSDSGNGALDYDTKCKVSGNAVLIAVGGSGMAQAPTRTIPCIFENVSCSSNTLISISDSNGKTILAYKAVKSFSNIVVCSRKLSKLKTYTISSGGTIEGEAKYMNYYESCTVTGAKKLTTAEPITRSSSSSSMGGGMGGPSGGGPGNQGGRFIIRKRSDLWQLS